MVFSGRITPADDETDEEFDEERALYGALHGKKWSEIPASFIKLYSYSIPLLTEEAFGIFLPAWLSGALDDREVRRAVVYAFSPHPRDEDRSFMNRRVQPLSGPQKGSYPGIPGSFPQRGILEVRAGPRATRARVC